MRALSAALLLLFPVVAAGQSPMDEAGSLILTYHTDPAKLDRARDLMERFLKIDSKVEGMILLARIYFLWGEVRATGVEEKLHAYDRGRELGKRAVELAPRNTDAHFWYATNTAKWGQTKGVLRSLFLLPTVRDELEIIFRLAPDHPFAHALAGNVDMEVPPLFGGSLERAEEHFRKALKTDPRLTGIRVDLARLLVKRGRYEEARKELQRVLSEKEPRYYADWAVKHSKKAKEILDSIKDKS
jgi:tetratricopeptide (TPR) repeat protein